MTPAHAMLEEMLAPDPFIPDPFPRPEPDPLRRYLIDERDRAQTAVRDFNERAERARDELDPSMANECAELALIHGARQQAMQDVLLVTLELERTNG